MKTNRDGVIKYYWRVFFEAIGIIILALCCYYIYLGLFAITNQQYHVIGD